MAPTVQSHLPILVPCRNLSVVRRVQTRSSVQRDSGFRKFAKEKSLALHLRMHNQEKSEAGEENTAQVWLPGVKFFSCPDCSRKFAEEKS